MTGGARSGKSRHAETLLAGLPAGGQDVTYIAPGRRTDGTDPDWDARVAAHRARRPAHWRTVETSDIGAALAAAAGPVLVDCLSTWLVALLDEARLWDADSADVTAVVDEHLAVLCRALDAAERAVLVTNEVGLGVVPAHRSGVLFRDQLGTANQRVAGHCDEVHLVIAGRVLKL